MRDEKKAVGNGSYIPVEVAKLAVRFSPKFYFVKVDVQACFDTIEQNKLLGILKSIISEVR